MHLAARTSAKRISLYSSLPLLLTPLDICNASRGRARIQTYNRGDVFYYKFTIDTASHTFLAHLPTLPHPPAAEKRNVSHYTHSVFRPFLPLTLVMRHSDARVASRRVASRVLPSTPSGTAAIVGGSVGWLDSSRNARPSCALTHPSVARVPCVKNERARTSG